MTDRPLDIVIGRCTDVSEAEALAALGALTFRETFGHLYKPADLEAFLKESHGAERYRELLRDKDCAVWIARDSKGDAVGYAVAGPAHLPIPDKPENAGELMRLYLRKEWQGGGLGGRLLAQALDWLEAKFDHLYLSVYAENFGAQRLYARHGFEIVHHYHYMVGEHADPEYIMKQTSSPAR